ncbi:MAG TPA: carboxypeptidase regulatory-like domain-containing protein [Pyrinomonadaceae bacterium]
MKKIYFPASRPPFSRRRLRFAFFFVLSLSLAASAAFLFSAATVEASKGAQKKRQAIRRRANAPRARKGAAVVPAAKSRQPSSAGIDEPTIGDPEDGDEREVIDARQQWFMMQRAYPFDAPPAEGRLKAWLARPKDAGRGKDGSIDTRSLAQSWRNIGPSPTTPAFPNNWGVTSGRLNSIAVHPTAPHIILIGTATGGIWRSTDGGVSFVPVSDTHVDLAVGSIAFSKSNPSIVYAGMGDLDNGYFGTGVLKSTDAGATWTRISNSTLPPLGTTAEIEVDPTNSNRVYVLQATRTLATSYNDLNLDGNLYRNGFYVSQDGGLNWQRTLAGRPRDIAIHPTNPQILYIGMTLVDPLGLIPAGAAGIYKSVDGGATWLPAPIFTAAAGTATSDVRIAVTPDAPERLYVVSGTRTAINVDISDNGGLTWTGRPTTGVDPGQFGYNAYLHVDPADADKIYIGTRDVFRSLNDGATWTNLTRNFNGANFSYTPFSSTTHPDQHAFAFVPNDPHTIYAGNDGGISKCALAIVNGIDTATCQSLNASLTLSQFIDITAHPTDPNVTYGGTQDNGTQVRSANGTWREFAEGDGGRPVVVTTPATPASPAKMFSTYVYGTIRRWPLRSDGSLPANDDFRTNDASFGECTPAPSKPECVRRIAFYPPFKSNGVDSTLYFGTYRLMVSADLAATWASPGGTRDLTKQENVNCSVSPAPAECGDVLSAIGVERKANAQVIYTGSARGRLMVSTDGGATWTDRTAGLPNRFIESITVDPANAAIAYVTFGGFGTPHVYRTTNSGATWANIGGTPGQATAIPNVPVSAFLIDPTSANTLYAGSDIGVFRSTDNGATWATFNNGMLPAIVTGFTTSAAGVIQLSTYGRGAYELTGAAVPAPVYTISGSIRNAAAVPFSGVAVALGGAQTATATTDAQGNYTFANLPAGNYTVTPSHANHTFAPLNQRFDNLSANQTANFTIAVQQYSIGGRVVDGSGVGLGGVGVTLAGGSPGSTTTTESGGFYAFNNVPAGGNYIVTPAKVNYTFTPANATVSNLSGHLSAVNFTGKSTCSYSVVAVSPQQFPASGGAGSFNIVTAAGCAWSALSLDPSWITITNGSGTGNGTVTYNVAPNTGAARNAQILHTDDSFYTVSQAAATSPAIVTFGVANYAGGEGEGRATITVTRSGNTSGAISVDVATVDDPAAVPCNPEAKMPNGLPYPQGKAYARCDYATSIETVSFAAGDTQPKTVVVPLIDDAHVEGAETAQLELRSPVNALLGTLKTATLTINDNGDASGAPNPINATPLFVRMQYLDFLSREPEVGEPWSGVLSRCANPFNLDPLSPSATCDRLIVSRSFFESAEFRLKGLFAFTFYRVAFNRLPEYAEIIPDMRSVTGQTPAEVYAKRALFPVNFTERAEFRAAYDALSNTAFVDALLARYPVPSLWTPDPANPEGGVNIRLTRADLINRLNLHTLTRAQAVRAIVESDEIKTAEYNRAYVAMQYYGYLRRTPEEEGYQAWLKVINADPTNVRVMINGFMNSNEYRARFGQ